MTDFPRSEGRLRAPGADRFAVVLVRPDTGENVGLAARGMANTGFRELRLVGPGPLDVEAYRTAVHAREILDGARWFPTLSDAIADRQLVLASTARARSDFPLVSLGEAARRVGGYPPATRVGVVFGNERTGLTGDEISLSNVRFHIPQAARQPSYNLGVAVTLTLFEIAAAGRMPEPPLAEPPLTEAEQDESARRFRDLLDGYGFLRDTNREFIEARVLDIFRRMTLNAKDRDIILAMFRRSFDAGAAPAGRPPRRPHPKRS